MSLSLKDLCYYLNFDEATWHKNKDMLGYIQGEKYEDFFYRKHGFKHTDQDTETRIIAASTDDRIIMLETKLNNANKALFKRLKLYETVIRNMDDILIKKVKGYTSMTGPLSLN